MLPKVQKASITMHTEDPSAATQHPRRHSCQDERFLTATVSPVGQQTTRGNSHTAPETAEWQESTANSPHTQYHAPTKGLTLCGPFPRIPSQTTLLYTAVHIQFLGILPICHSVSTQGRGRGCLGSFFWVMSRT